MTRSGLILPVLLLTLIGCGGNVSSDGTESRCVEKDDTVVVITTDGNQVKQGQSSRCYSNGGWAYSYTNKIGDKQALEIAWYENGKKRSEAVFEDGKEHGKQTTWHKNGYKRSETVFKDGKEHGRQILWHDNGNKKAEIEYQDGKYHGAYTCWHKNGQKSLEETYHAGELPPGSWRDARGQLVTADGIDYTAPIYTKPRCGQLVTADQ